MIYRLYQISTILLGILLFFGTSRTLYPFLEEGKYLVNSNSIVLDTAFHSKDKSDLKYDLSTHGTSETQC